MTRKSALWRQAQVVNQLRKIVDQTSATEAHLMQIGLPTNSVDRIYYTTIWRYPVTGLAFLRKPLDCLHLLFLRDLIYKKTSSIHMECGTAYYLKHDDRDAYVLLVRCNAQHPYIALGSYVKKINKFLLK